MKIGTAYFVSIEKAVRYYSYGFSKRQVAQKIAEGEIFIGPPPEWIGAVCGTIDNGARYLVTIGE